MPRTTVFKYTPGQLSPAALEATYVDRDGLLGQLTARVRQWCDGAGPEHTLLLGPRGIGKTHLLRLLAQRLASTPGPGLRVVSFPEESYGVGSADELVIQIWARLSESEAHVPPRPVERGAAWALDRLREMAERDGARFLVLLDGLDLLLGQLRERDEGEIHRLMTTEPHLCMVAAAARLPDAVLKHDRPLFHAFRLERLRPLGARQAEELLRRHAEAGGERDLLSHWDELAPRVRAMADLAGGNPRLLLMLYQSLEPGEILSVIEAFRALLDELTPFFKGVVESRAPQQRKLLSLAAFHYRGPSPSQLAAESGLPERQVAALLGHLVEDGLVKRVRRPGSRTSAYPFVDPLLRMWLQMRSSPEGEQRVACIVEFFRVWYARAEPEYERAISQEAERVLRLATAGQETQLEESMLGLRYLAEAAPSRRSAQKALAALEAGRAAALVSKAMTLREAGRSEDAIASYDEVVHRFEDRPEPAILEQVARALVNKGVSLGTLGRSGDEVATYEEVLRRFGDRPELAILEQVGRALLNKGVTLGSLGRAEEAVAAYGEVLDRFGDRAEPDILKVLAMALFDKGVTLGTLSRFEEEIATYQGVVERFGDCAEPTIVQLVALAMMLKALRLGAVGRSQHAIAALDEVVHRFGDRPEPAILELVAMALMSKAVSLGELGRSQEAVAALDEIVRRFRDRAEPAILNVVAAALAFKGRALGDLGGSSEAMAVVLSKMAPEARAEPLLAYLRPVFGSGDLRLCQEALEALGRSADPTLLVPFQQAVSYLEGGRDPYFLEALNPDVRRAVELLVAEFDAGRSEAG